MLNFKNVLYVASIKAYLISISQLYDEGNKVNFSKVRMVVNENGEL